MFEKLINEMENLVKGNLISVVKFGSEGEPNNLLFVLGKLDFEVLNEIKKLIVKERKKGSVVPLIFTKEELFDGADVFPLEFLDIINPHKTVYGEEIINKIKLDKKHVRRQLEFELRSKLIHLRENYVWISKDKEFQQLLKSAVPSLMPLFYGLLYLKNVKPVISLDGLFSLVEEKYDVDLSVLKKIKGMDGKATFSKEYVKDLMVQLEELVDMVDEMKI